MNKKFPDQDRLKWHGTLSTWRTKMEDFIVECTGNPDIGTFALRGVLPSDHTQNANCFYQVAKGGKYVRNLLPYMAGTVDIVERYYTPTQYDKLSYDDQQECEEVHGNIIEEANQGSSMRQPSKRNRSNNTRDVDTQNEIDEAEATPRILRYVMRIKVEVPMNPDQYPAQYVGDPFKNIRVMVRDKDYDRLSKVEKKFVEGLHLGCIAVGMTLSDQVHLHMEAQEEYKISKQAGRVDVIVKLILIACTTGGVSKRRYDACPNSRNYFTNITNAYIGSTSLIKHLSVFEENMTAMRLSGFDDEARSSWGVSDGYDQAGGIDQESPVNYMCAQYLFLL